MFPESAGRVCQEVKLPARDCQWVLQNFTNSFPNEGSPIHASVPSIVQVFLVNKAYAKEVVMMVRIGPQHTVRLKVIGNQARVKLQS